MERIIEKRQFSVPKQPRAVKVAAYARVSTGKDAMLHSLSAQVSYYNELIQNHPGWLYCGVYTDEALTGTKESRAGFQRMVADCKAGEINLIITKSISRFARNTVTLLETVRELKRIGVDVFFEEQNIHTLSSDGELMMTILASYAQEESLSASENQKWRIRKGFENGELLCWRFLYGYKISKGHVEIDDEQAEIIKEIFARVIRGESMNSVSRDLNKRGIPCMLGGQWKTQRIHDILANEKYIGNALLQKHYRNNHLEKRILRNNGELPMYYAERTHDAIIDEATFEAAQEILTRNAATHATKAPKTKSPFSSFIRCEKCGRMYKHCGKTGHKFWNCSGFQEYGKKVCRETRIPDDILFNTTADVIGSLDFENTLHSVLTEIQAKDTTLTFCFKDGTEVKREWQFPSRSESWTEEMREAALTRMQEQRRKCK